MSAFYALCIGVVIGYVVGWALRGAENDPGHLPTIGRDVSLPRAKARIVVDGIERGRW